MPLIACLAFGFTLRVVGVKYGLPNLYYWDEPTVVNRAVRFGSGDLNPHFFYYPALYMYVLFAAIGLYFATARAFGIFHGASDFARTYFTNPSGVYTFARVTTALVGTLALALTFFVGKRYFRASVGLVAALFLAVSPLHASHAHIAITDTAHALLICAALLPLYDVVHLGRWRDYLLAGVLIGLGIATKYLAGMHVVTLLAAHCLRDDGWAERRRNLGALCADLASWRLLAAYASVFVAFFIGTPYNVLAFRDFIQDFRLQLAISAAGSARFGELLRVLPVDFGWPICVLGLVGLSQILAKPTRPRLVFLVFPAVYALSLLRMTKVFPRYLLPQSAFIAIIAAHGLFVLHEALAPRLSPLVGRVVLLGLVLVAAATPFWRTLVWDELLARSLDTRTAALDWVNGHIAAGSRVSVQSLFNRSFDNVPLVTDQTLLRLEHILPSTGKFGQVRQEVLDSWAKNPVYRETDWDNDPQALRASGVRYVLLTDAYGPPSSEVQAWLDGSGHVIQRFEPSLPPALTGIGSGVLSIMPPTITIYEMTASSRTAERTPGLPAGSGAR